jgi:hypothetical protein
VPFLRGETERGGVAAKTVGGVAGESDESVSECLSGSCSDVTSSSGSKSSCESRYAVGKKRSSSIIYVCYAMSLEGSIYALCVLRRRLRVSLHVLLPMVAVI